jgi:hypothetical protein
LPRSPRNLGVRRIERIIESLRLAPSQLSAQRIESSITGVGWELRALQKQEHEVDKLPARHVEKALRFVV